MTSSLAWRQSAHATASVLPNSCFYDTQMTAIDALDIVMPNFGVSQYQEIGTNMTYVVNDKCIMCKYTDCVEVCPVDCFYEGENFLAINPDECIDCGVCEPECPAEAIIPDSEPGAEQWLELNREMSEIWPNIGERKDPMPDADKMRDETGKYEKYFSKAPGAGA